MKKSKQLNNAIPWWKKTTVYQIYPRSFQDSNNDGIGDLPGIISRLDYLEQLGIETIWFSPFYDSPQEDFGYDIRNYRSISPEYGTMKDCDALIREIHSRKMKIVMDMVLNHTSDKHPWFIESRSSRDNPKRDWYIWKDGQGKNGKKPPNNWKSMITGSGWHLDENTKQWYLAQFAPFQPDLNYRNPEVKSEMLDTMKFWLEKGVDGFRLDMINAIYEDPEFRNNPWSWRLLPSEKSMSMLFQNPKYTLNHPDTIDFMKELRNLIEQFTDPPRFLVGEVTAPLNILKRYTGENGERLNLTFQFQSLGLKMKAKLVKDLIKNFETEFADPLLPTWVFSNHDRMRRISRLGGDIQKAKLSVALQLTARGIPFIYYGEEIGMEQHDIPIKESKDVVAKQFHYVPQFIPNLVKKIFKESINRDECRTPMQWNDSANAGFCPESASPWLPITKSFKERNVATEEKQPDSLLNCYKRFLRARRNTPALNSGALYLQENKKTSGNVVHFIRSTKNQDENSTDAHVFLNFGNKNEKIRPPEGKMKFLVSTTIQSLATEVRGEAIKLAPWEGLVLLELS
ncbi:MAG: alpha-glucosidase [Promethearchaeota archaeon]